MNDLYFDIIDSYYLDNTEYNYYYENNELILVILE